VFATDALYSRPMSRVQFLGRAPRAAPSSRRLFKILSGRPLNDRATAEPLRRLPIPSASFSVHEIEKIASRFHVLRESGDVANSAGATVAWMEHIHGLTPWVNAPIKAT